ncbi:MAG: hypothetical protein KJO21_03095 [Verrucomicrobiae bacterium]|nr:hypothetical protein [Verrucomicrobiae bacterium]
MKKGELVPGAALLVEGSLGRLTSRLAKEDEDPTLEPLVHDPDDAPKLIPEEYLEDYFLVSPTSSEGYLIDPQRLLSMQETMDRKGFLAYHAEDSEVDIQVYLFDAQQEIPDPYSIEELVQSHYASNPLSAVVFCFMGEPSRNVLAFAGEGSANIPDPYVGKILESAQMKAQEKSDPSAQLESFVVQLSIKLYWLEKGLEESRRAAVPVAVRSANPEGNQGERSPSPGVMATLGPYLFYGVAATIGIVLAGLGIGIAWVLWRRSRTYHFPVIEPPRRLGANYAAGVGAVLAFHNKLGSPSSQRDQVPDYLTRM